MSDTIDVQVNVQAGMGFSAMRRIPVRERVVAVHPDGRILETILVHAPAGQGDVDVTQGDRSWSAWQRDVFFWPTATAEQMRAECSAVGCSAALSWTWTRCWSGIFDRTGSWDWFNEQIERLVRESQAPDVGQ